MLKIFEEYKDIYPEYFEENSKYKYGSADNWLIVFEKLTDTITNEDRQDIFDAKYAEYIADKLLVVLIVNKHDPNEKTDKTIHFQFCNMVNYTVGEIIERKVGHRLHYYNCVDPAYFEDIMYDGYTGLYFSWFDNGLLSEKGNYVNGLRHGIWTFGSGSKPINNVQELREEEYSNGNIIPKTLNNYQLIKWTPPIQFFNKESYIYTNFYWMAKNLSLYTDPYLPTYLQINYWIDTNKQ